MSQSLRIESREPESRESQESRTEGSNGKTGQTMSIPIFNDIRERTSSRFQARARRVQGDIRGRIRSFDRVRSVMRFSLRWRTSRPVVGKHDVATYHAHTHTNGDRASAFKCMREENREKRKRQSERERKKSARAVGTHGLPTRSRVSDLASCVTDAAISLEARCASRIETSNATLPFSVSLSALAYR